MAYLLGLVTEEQAKELEKRGWQLENAEDTIKEVLRAYRESERMRDAARKARDNTLPDRLVGVFVDSDLSVIMDGPDWDKQDEIRATRKSMKLVVGGSREAVAARKRKRHPPDIMGRQHRVLLRAAEKRYQAMLIKSHQDALNSGNREPKK